MSEPRAIVFDLDDTLYPTRRFLSSGFAAVADAVAPEIGVPAADILTVLRDARRFMPGRELQFLCDRFGLPASAVDRWVQIIRGHWPDIRLPLESARVLMDLQSTWRIGVLTNGYPDVQRRKVAALGLRELVDAVVFATEYGDGRGKPDRAPFLTVLDELNVPADRAVFVGDDLDADVFGAGRVGMRTIHIARDVWHAFSRPWIRPDARVSRIASVPRAAERLVGGEQRVHAA
jgi:putative hydrolase of the HAD superfamily